MPITKHAIKRIRQRCGIRNRKRARQTAKLALKKGIDISLLPNFIQDYVKENISNANTLVYKNFIYITKNNSLLTVYQLPDELVKKFNKHKQNQIQALVSTIEKHKQETDNLKSKVNDLVCYRCNGKFRVTQTKNIFKLQCVECSIESKTTKSLKKQKIASSVLYQKDLNKN